MFAWVKVISTELIVNLNYILRIMETHSHTAVPVQLDPAKGLLGFHTSKDRVDELLAILENIPRPLTVLDSRP
ncbi:MAG: DUF4911 domain-containing protein [Peptococcaceae bacterium]|nr:DUF4911 domain-containing protein [Peptococcaceae bacterium]MDH7525319.1 DUF4911 domain-containing protein [Peptococcaceae bacterium]